MSWSSCGGQRLVNLKEQQVLNGLSPLTLATFSMPLPNRCAAWFTVHVAHVQMVWHFGQSQTCQSYRKKGLGVGHPLSGSKSWSCATSSQVSALDPPCAERTVCLHGLKFSIHQYPPRPPRPPPCNFPENGEDGVDCFIMFHHVSLLVNLPGTVILLAELQNWSKFIRVDGLIWINMD